MKGELIRISRDYKTGKPEITLAVDADLERLEDLMGMPLTVELEKWKDRRSTSANNYFHRLVDKLADKRGISKTRCKNEMITSYGQKDYLGDGTVVAIKSNIPPEQMWEQEALHCLLRKTDPDDPDVYFYIVYRGTHTYNTAEMSYLIDGVIAEAKDAGIETITENEKREMMERYGINHDDN